MDAIHISLISLTVTGLFLIGVPIFLVGDAIGSITPPYGLNLYVASGITGIPYFRLLKYSMPHLLALLFAWLIIALMQELSTLLLVHGGAGVFQLT